MWMVGTQVLRPSPAASPAGSRSQAPRQRTWASEEMGHGDTCFFTSLFYVLNLLLYLSLYSFLFRVFLFLFLSKCIFSYISLIYLKCFSAQTKQHKCAASESRCYAREIPWPEDLDCVIGDRLPPGEMKEPFSLAN